MKIDSEEIRIGGKSFQVPATCINGRRVVVAGTWVRFATVKDEELFQGEAVDDPEQFISQLKASELRADIFSFAQRLTDPKPKYGYHMEWDNAAVIPLKDYSDWWDKRLSQDSRRNMRRAGKMGVTIKPVTFSDELVQGIKDIYDETPVRQGTRFKHYQKAFDVVKQECSTYLDRSEFIGAYLDGALIGFLKMTYADNCARILHILSKEEHSDKRPTNALIAKAVEICTNKGLTYLTYCRYIDGGNEKSTLTEFKRRNGFEQLVYPRYFIALTAKGKAALALRVHHGLRNVLPKALVPVLLDLRAKFYSFTSRKPAPATREPVPGTPPAQQEVKRVG